jgi:Kef-type K+ transport system membrane component KefB
MPIVLLFGIILLLGLLTGRLSARFGIPQVVGFILCGVLLGNSSLNVLSDHLLNQFIPFTSIALALIGFRVGGDLSRSVFSRYGKQLITIMLAEGLLAMTVVALLVSLYTGNLALGILLGAMSAATAPAATVDVLWEYRSRGPLTTTILAIVALDDGLALLLYGFALAFADALLLENQLSPKIMLFEPLIEIVGSLTIGLVIGFLLDKWFKFVKKEENQLIVTLGAILLATGAAMQFDFSLILTNMIIGFYLTNVHPHRHESIFEMIKSFAPPIYVVFFVFVGARLHINLLPQMGILGILYVIGRTAGKWTGAYWGSRISAAPESVRRYLGLALFSQAGVAIGLSLDVFQHYAHLVPRGVQLGQTVVNVVTATTFLVQIIGPPFVKYAIFKAGEIDRSIESAKTEEEE